MKNIKKFKKELLFFLSFVGKKSIFSFSFALVLTTLFDLLSVCSTAGFVSLILNFNNSKLFGIVQKFFDISYYSKIEVLSYAGLFVLFVTILKTSLSVLVDYKIFDMVQHIEQLVGRLIARSFINLDYEEYLLKDRSMVESLALNTHRFGMLFYNVLKLATNGLILMAFTVLLSFFQPYLLLCISLSCLCFFYLHQIFLNKPIIKSRNDLIKGYQGYVHSYKNIFTSFKEIKLYSKNTFFEKLINDSLRQKCTASANQSFFSTLPRHLLELFSLTLIVAFSNYLILSNTNFSASLSILSLYAISFVRLMPTINHIFSGFIQIKNERLFLSKFYEEVKDKLTHGDQETSSDILLEKDIVIENISYCYPKSNHPVLKAASLSINKNTVIGLVGISGAGKSTFVNILCGLIKPHQGDILADGFSIYSALSSWRNKFAYIPQNTLLLDNTVLHNIALGEHEDEINLDKIKKHLKSAEILDFIESLPDGLLTKVGDNGVRLSGGQRQRIALARALYQEKEILILDEATSALDSKTESKILKLISQLKNKTIIIISHNLQTLSFCDKIYEVRDKKITEVSLDFHRNKANTFVSELKTLEEITS